MGIYKRSTPIKKDRLVAEASNLLISCKERAIFTRKAIRCLTCGKAR